MTGCSDSKIDAAVQKVFQPRRTPQQYMLVAVSDADADMRRDAVARIAKSKASNQDWAIKGYIAIALLEDDPQARCVAIRALARTADPRATETLLKILNHEDYPPAEVRPPDALSRWDATTGLAALSSIDQVPPERREEVRSTLAELLKNDPDRNVRICAARGVGFHPHAETPPVLIAALRDGDFAVVYEAESALVRLTGETHDCDASAWEAWWERNQSQPFARAGALPDSRKPRYQGRLDKMAYDTRQLFRWLFPGAKEK